MTDWRSSTLFLLYRIYGSWYFVSRWIINYNVETCLLNNNLELISNPCSYFLNSIIFNCNYIQVILRFMLTETMKKVTKLNTFMIEKKRY